MTISNPQLTITFYKSTPETVTVSNSDIIRHSFTFKEQILNGLGPSSNSVALKLHRDASVISKILSYQVDAKAVLSDGNTTLFTGYLSDNYTWMVNTTGESELEIVIEDVGTKLLGKAFLTTDSPSVYYLAGKIYSGNNSVLSQICTRAGIPIAANQDVIATEIAANIDKNVTCKELIGNILLEAGYTYYFNNLGALCLYKIDCTSINNVPVIDKNQLYEVNKNAITLTKRVKQYKQVNVSYDEYETRNNVLVYKDISGQDSSHPDCNIIIKPNAYYPVQLKDVATVNEMKALGTADVELNSYVRVTGINKVYQVVELGTQGADYDGTTYSFIESSVSEVSFVEAKDLDSGKEVISISNVSGTVSYTGSVSYTISQRGSKNISVVLHNTGSSDANVTKLQATATIVDLKAKCIVVSGESSSSNESENVYSTAARYIHTRENASLYANLISNYYKYCNYTYQFNAIADYALGSIVKVVDNIFSGLTVNLLLTAKNYTDKSNVIKYTGVAVSPFDLSAETEHEQTLEPDDAGVPGPAGKGITSIVDWYATSATPTGQKTAYDRTLPTLNPTTKKYLWIKQITTYTDGTTSYTESIGAVYGDSGENADAIDVILDSQTYLNNLRLSGSNAVEGVVSLQGQYSSGTVTVTEPSGTSLAYIIEKNGTAITATDTISVVDGDTFKLAIPYTSKTSVDVSLTSSSETITKVISSVDGTVYGFSYGLLASAPTSSSDPMPIYEEGRETDYYTNSSNGITYEYVGTGWVPCSDAQRLTTGLKLLLDNGTDLASISNANTVSFFRDIIAQKIYADTIKAVQGFFDSITVTGNSFFNGTIKSSAFSTTLQNDTPSSTTTISLGNTAYWNWDTFKPVLQSHYSSGAYTSVSGTYSSIRVGTSRISLPYGPDSGGIVLDNNNRTKTTSAFPRTQRVSIISESHGSTGTGGLVGIEITVGGTTVGFIENGNGTIIVNVPKGSSITAKGIISGTNFWNAGIFFYDVPGDYPDVCFFDSSGAVHTYSGYNTGTLTVDSYSPSPLIYKWGGMSSASGGGETTANSAISVVNEDASINISNKPVTYVSWTSANQLRVVFSDYSEILLDTSLYYRSMSGSFSLLTASDSVVSATITPKTGTNTVGAAGNPFNEGHFNTVNSNTFNGTTFNGTTFNGNVNSQGTSNKVWGAVFN